VIARVLMNLFGVVYKRRIPREIIN